MGNVKLNYRPEIDGLRAIAVVSVILYHANINIFNYKIFSGGFVGVDIFFVISGYLITSLILKELKTTGKFSFLNFYQRRARRILPALFFVMAVSLPFAWLYLLPSSLLDFSKSILYSIGFGSNYYFYFSNLQYGTEDSFLKPFLHTWSLSVEEQFYILFPITIIIIFKFFKKYLFEIIIFFIILSFICAIYISSSNPSASFYFLHTRIWELLSGSVLAYIEIKNSNKFSNKLLHHTGSSSGLIIIAFSVFFLNDKISNAPLYLLLVIIGTCLIIKFCNKNDFAYNILSNKIFVNTGLISYSLYLWHYPIFAFYRYAFSYGNIYIKIFIGFLLVVLSILTYLYIEKKFRNEKVNKFYFSLSAVVLIIIFSCYSILKNGRINKINTTIGSFMEYSNIEDGCRFVANDNFINNTSFIKKFNYCNKKHSKAIIIVGDSHSFNIYNSIFLNTPKKYIISLGLNGCRPSEDNLRCNKHYLNILKFLEKNSIFIDHIIFNIGGYQPTQNLPIDSKELTSAENCTIGSKQIDYYELNLTLDYIKKLNKYNNVIFIGPHIEPGIKLNRINALRIINDKNILEKKYIKDCKIKLIDNYLQNLSKENKILYISKVVALNFNFKKDFIVGNEFNFGDGDHWSRQGEIIFGGRLINNSILSQILFK